MDAPRTFTLTIDQKTCFPCIRIFNDVLGNLPGPYHTSAAEHMMKSLNLNPKDFPQYLKPGQYFGFGTGLELIENDGEQTTYRMNLPIIRKKTKKNCLSCNGKSKSNGHRCFRCDGTGKEDSIDNFPAYALSASVGMFSNLLELTDDFDVHEKNWPKQILTLNMITEICAHGGSLGGSFSPSFINFLKMFQEDREFPQAAQAMTLAYQHMWCAPDPAKERRYEISRIRAYQNLRGNLLLDVPGDACGVHPSPHVGEIDEGYGVDWTCHNVDTPLQQLTLLTGLAAMCDLYDGDV